jgi:hypothetical protein
VVPFQSADIPLACLTIWPTFAFSIVHITQEALELMDW